MAELLRESPTKTIGVNVKQRQISQQTQLFRQVPGDVAMVQINAGDSTDRGIIRCRSAKHSVITAHIRSDPISGQIVRVRENSLFPGLKGNVGISDPRVFKPETRVDGHFLATVAELVRVVEELPVPNIADLDITEFAIANESRGNRE